MIQVKYKKNFNIEKMLKAVRISSSILLNDIAEPVKEGWDKDIKEGSHKGINDSTRKLHGDHRPLNLTGKLAKSNKILKATPKKLKAVVKNVAKSSVNYKIKKPNGKTYRGKRKSAPVFYGYYQNKGLKQTASNSLVPNKRVQPRNFVDKTLDNLEKHPKYKKAQERFKDNLEKSMRIASK
tara:strand:- start:1439 stop:1981 length:543 start_codon:yes stop_codon:yes gene_type:complete